MKTGLFARRSEAEVREAWAAVEAAAREGHLHRVVAPLRLEDGVAVSPAGSRAAQVTLTLLIAWLRGEWKPPAGELATRVLYLLDTVREDLELGPWLRYIDAVAGRTIADPGGKPVPPVRLGTALARRSEGRVRVRTPTDPEAYLLEATRAYAQERQRLETEKRLEKLVVQAEKGKLKAEHLIKGHKGWTRVALGRLRDGRRIWVVGNAKQVARARKILAAQLVRPSRALPDRWRYTRKHREHPVIRARLAQLRAWLKEHPVEVESLERPDGWVHDEVIREEEHALLEALGLEFDALFRASVLKAVNRFLQEREDLPGETPVELLETAMTPDAWLLLGEEGVPTLEAVRKALERIRRRLESPPELRREHPLRQSVIQVLRSYPRLSQVEVRDLHRRVLEKEAAPEEQNLLVRAVLPVAVAAGLPYADAGVDVVGVAWEVAREAVTTQRSTKHHPGAMVERLAARRFPYEVEIARQALTVRPSGIKTLHRIRKLYFQGITDPATLASQLRVPARWVELHLPLLRTTAPRLEDPVGEEGTLAETLAVPGPDPEETTERAVLRKVVERALERLPVVHREAVERVFMEGAPLEEVAESTGYAPEFLEKVLEEARGELAADPYLRAWAA